MHVPKLRLKRYYEHTAVELNSNVRCVVLTDVRAVVQT